MTQEDLERHSQMLGRIGGWVSEFLPENSTATTEEGVIRVLYQLRAYQLKELETALDSLVAARTNNNEKV